jgi:fused signal recognition particle receptor
MTFFDRLRIGLRRTTEQIGARVEEALGLMALRNDLTGKDNSGFEILEELLLEADVGVVATGQILARLQAIDSEKRKTGELRDELKNELLNLLSCKDDVIEEVDGPRISLLVGVNGTGKTTTAGKLAYRMRANGERPLLCAADTFRAAAVEQLGIWATKAKVDIVKGVQGSDPAAVVYDAIQAGRARKRDVVVVDTAGRLHTQVNLMEELRKIQRIASREVQGAPHDVLLVIDATVGQNGLSQAREFLKVVEVDGIVLTKLDGTARGGIAVAISAELGVPIRYVGVGEGIGDLVPFSARDYVEGLLAH